MKNIKTTATPEKFPISQTQTIHGSRRLAREKVLQILVAHSTSQTDLSFLFEHIFFRDYRFGNKVEDKSDRLLKNDEIQDLDADIAINWKADEIEFGKILINRSTEINDFVMNILRDISENWNFDRISIIDKNLIVIAVTEFMYFPSIPIKVSINEAIEISKYYSTDKSTQFINGILDKFLLKLNEDCKINKTVD